MHGIGLLPVTNMRSGPCLMDSVTMTCFNSCGITSLPANDTEVVF